jgi:formylglycine-generating enzyme required for sulfatase activity
MKDDAVIALRKSFVLIPAGEFRMGSVKGSADERPVHLVRISRPFEMGKYEITQTQWQSLMGSSDFRGPTLPVESVSWNDAQQFIQKLNAQNDGYTYRLPTEAEWEYACRAGSAGTYSGDLAAMAWYVSNAGGTTHAVGQKEPNAWGLHDMHGNVSEWCQDWFSGGYYTQSPGVDPAGPSAGSDRVLRGGSWLLDSASSRSAARYARPPGVRESGVGFRLVRTRR